MENAIFIEFPEAEKGKLYINFGRSVTKPGHRYGPAVRIFYLIHYIVEDSRMSLKRYRIQEQAKTTANREKCCIDRFRTAPTRAWWEPFSFLIAPRSHRPESGSPRSYRFRRCP